MKICWSILVISLMMKSVVLAQDPCAGKRGREARVLYDYRQGLDLSLYNRIPGQHTVQILAGESFSVSKSEAQRQAWANAFDKIDHLGLSYNLARPAYEEGYRLLRQEKNPAVLRQEIKIYQEIETYDWSQCRYIYEVELAVPSVPNLGRFSNELRKIVESFRLPEPTGDKVEISVDKLIDLLLKDPHFAELAKKMMADEEFKRSLPYRDDDTQSLIRDLSDGEIEITNYRRGQYRISALVGSLIQQAVVPRVIALLGRYDRVKVTCWGYTDPLKVKRIIYRGFANFGELDLPVSYQSPSSSADPAERVMQSNSELSIARGFEGIQALKIALGQQAKNPRLSFEYAGGGEIPSATKSRPESRKIKYVIEFR